jgi:hypothetical protein
MRGWPPPVGHGHRGVTSGLAGTERCGTMSSGERGTAQGSSWAVRCSPRWGRCPQGSTKGGQPVASRAPRPECPHAGPGPPSPRRICAGSRPSPGLAMCGSWLTYCAKRSSLGKGAMPSSRHLAHVSARRSVIPHSRSRGTLSSASWFRSLKSNVLGFDDDQLTSAVLSR